MSNYPATAQTAVPAYGSKIINGATSFNGALTIAPDAASSGARTCITVTQPADTAITASTEQPIVFYDFSATQTWATGSLTTQRFLRIAAPTIAFAGASTVTTAATVDIAGAPIAGTNATITNAYALRVATGASYFGGAVAMTPVAATSGTRSALTVTGAADTGVTASTEQNDVYLNLSHTVTWAAGPITNQRAIRVAAPTYAFSGPSTVVNAATLYVDNAPSAGTNATITNAYALWVDDGMTRLDGALTVGSYSILTGNVGVGSAAPASAALAVSSTTQGFLPPRMTGTQRDAIAAPAAGLVVYNTTTNKLNFYNGSAWEVVTSA